jgi:hypothetical protein
MFHSVRNSAFCVERTFLLSDRVLSVVSANGDPGYVPLQSVREVRLQSTGDGSRRCVISTRSLRLVLTDRHYVRPGVYEDRGESYTGFLDALHERLRPYAANVRFTRGTNRSARLALAMFLLLPLLYVSGLLAFSQTDATRTWPLYPALLIVSISLIVAVLPLMKANRRRPAGVPKSSGSDAPPSETQCPALCS